MSRLSRARRLLRDLGGTRWRCSWCGRTWLGDEWTPVRFLTALWSQETGKPRPKAGTSVMPAYVWEMLDHEHAAEYTIVNTVTGEPITRQLDDGTFYGGTREDWAEVANVPDLSQER